MTGPVSGVPDNVVELPSATPTLEEARAYFAEMAALPRLALNDLLTVPLEEIRKGGDWVVVDERVAGTLLRIGAIAEATGGLGCRWQLGHAVLAIRALAAQLAGP